MKCNYRTLDKELNVKKFSYVVGLMLLFISCKDSAPAPSTTTPGKRDYTWTRDTLFYLGNAQTAMQSIYASSTKNVYVVGHCEVSAGRMWHYDGTGWGTVNVSSVRGYLNAIAGNAANDIWVVGGQAFFPSDSSRLIDSTLVVHFDGNTWQQINVRPRKGELQCVALISPTSLFAAGGQGALYRFDHGSWELYEVGAQYFISSITALSSSEAYAIGHVDDSVVPVDSAGSFLFRYDGNRWIPSCIHRPHRQLTWG